MEIVLYLILLFGTKGFIKKLHPEVANPNIKLGWIIAIPLLFVFMGIGLVKECYGITDMATNVDQFRYLSTYLPYVGGELELIANVAQQYGYLSDEIMEISPLMASVFSKAAMAQPISLVSCLLSLVLAVLVGTYLYKLGSVKMKTLNIVTFALGSLMAITFILYGMALYNLFVYLKIFDNDSMTTLVVIAIIAIGLGIMALWKFRKALYELNFYLDMNGLIKQPDKQQGVCPVCGEKIPQNSIICPMCNEKI